MRWTDGITRHLGGAYTKRYELRNQGQDGKGHKSWHTCPIVGQMANDDVDK